MIAPGTAADAPRDPLTALADSVGRWHGTVEERAQTVASGFEVLQNIGCLGAIFLDQDWRCGGPVP